MDRKPQPNTYYRNLAMAAIAGQSGCSTVIIVFAALFAGLFIELQASYTTCFYAGAGTAERPAGVIRDGPHGALGHGADQNLQHA